MSAAAVLEVSHETRYLYGARVDLAHHLAHLRPRRTLAQEVQHTSLTIEPQPQHWTQGEDVFGNAREAFALYVPHEALRVLVRSRVALRAAAQEAVPPAAALSWEEVAQSCRFQAGSPFVAESEFVFASPFVPLLAALRDYGAPSFTPGRALPDAAGELMRRIQHDFTYDGSATEVHTPLAQVLEARRGVCQDFAHLMIGAMRTLGLPARYVSGYLLTRPPLGRQRLLGADASHAWVSVWCPPLGWLDFDPTNAVLPGEAATHVTLAIGRDYGDVMPLRGVIRGGGEHTLTVAVSVVPQGA